MQRGLLRGRQALAGACDEPGCGDVLSSLHAPALHTDCSLNPTNGQVVNKMDRPALNGFEIIEQLEKEFGLTSFPVTWPIGSGAPALRLARHART